MGPGAAPEMEPRPMICSLTGTKSSAQSTQESNERSSQRTCRLEKLALARSKLVQAFIQNPLRLETTNLGEHIFLFFSKCQLYIYIYIYIGEAEIDLMFLCL